MEVGRFSEMFLYYTTTPPPLDVTTTVIFIAVKTSSFASKNISVKTRNDQPILTN
jgi:hypothetical protein